MFRRFGGFLIAAGLVTGSATAAPPQLEKVDLFEAGKGGYALYRIPGLVATAQGTLIAYCEARKSGEGDWGTIDILMRRSTDGGKTWSPAKQIVSPPADARRNPVALEQKLGKPDDLTINNPVAIVDRRAGTVLFLYCVEYARCFAMRSDDDGATFGAPTEITSVFEQFRPEYPWRVLATGPGHGIQLASGRLLVPVWLSLGTGGHGHRPSAVATIVSDDHGASWKRGAIVVSHPHPIHPSETTAVELTDGRVMLNIRHESEPHQRGVTMSAHGVSGWSALKYDEQLPEPVCFGSLARLSTRPDRGRDRLLFVNPHNAENRERRNLTVKLSYDEGETWPTARTVEPGPSGYADLAVTSDGMISCFYERGSVDQNRFRPRSLCVARFNLEWLTDGKDSLDRPRD